jgi:hypothetical protein
MAEDSKQISIWFFIGALLAIYGAIILVAGIADWNKPGNVVMADLHVPVWWGALLLIVGGIYSYVFRPRQT